MRHRVETSFEERKAEPRLRRRTLGGVSGEKSALRLGPRFRVARAAAGKKGLAGFRDSSPGQFYHRAPAGRRDVELPTPVTPLDAESYIE